MKVTKFVLAGKASQVFKLLALLARVKGNVKLKDYRGK